MKTLLSLLIFVCCFSCTNKELQNPNSTLFSIRCDTVILNINSLNPNCDYSYLEHVCEYSGRYIMQFDAREIDDSIDLYALNHDLSSISVFSRPEDALHITNLCVLNDTLIAYTKNDLYKYSQYFDLNNNKWQKILPYTDNTSLNFYRYYEDEEYNVNISVREEGLVYLTFVDKLTNSRHLFQTLDLVQLIKLDSTYYCIGDDEITTIPYPRNGKFTESVYNHLYVDNCASYPEPLIKVHSYSDNYTPDTLFCASIVLNNNLYVFAKDGNSFAIKQLEGNKLTKVCDLSKSISIMGFGRKDLNNVCQNNQTISPFYWRDEFGKYQSGILDIQDSDFHFIHFFIP